MSPAPIGSSCVFPGPPGCFTVRDLDTAIFIYMRSLDDPSLGVDVRDALKVGPAQHDVVFSGQMDTARRLELELLNGFKAPVVRVLGAQKNLKRIIRRAANEGSGKR